MKNKRTFLLILEVNRRIKHHIIGILKPHMSNLNDLNPDYAYKVTYLGHYKNASITEDSTVVIEPLVIIDKQENIGDFLVIYPNPNNGEFQISCEEEIQEIKIFNDKGEIVLDIKDLNSFKFNAKLNLESGSYLIQILTISKIFINKKIVVL